MPEKRRSAFLKATQEAQKAPQQDSQTVIQVEGNAVSPLHSKADRQEQGQTVTPLHSDTASQLESITAIPVEGETVKQQSSTTAKKEEKITFYLTTEQADKLDDLAYQYKKRNGKRINRNDIVRYLIDQSSIEALRDM